MLVLLCLGGAELLGREATKFYRVAYCTNKADPATSLIVYGHTDMDNTRNSVAHAAWYPDLSFGPAPWNRALPCVRWFGSTYPNKAPYDNATAVDRAQPDA